MVSLENASHCNDIDSFFSIYPSQSVDDDPNEPAVLLCTYTVSLIAFSSTLIC